MKKLTVIIPFLNEKDEVENTLESIYAHKGQNELDIIVINDASDDGYAYDSLRSTYPITYIRNEFRQGVAKSRDIGVSCCNTPYFLLLDAHMRFYSDTWIHTIVEMLEKNDRLLLCCQNRALEKKDVTIIDHGISTLGAYINMITYSPKWILAGASVGYYDTNPIPCVLGASYAASKRYWQYLRGLKGLRSYGLDESFISLKVWMEGGACLLLRNVEIGHIYRKNGPYRVPMVDMMYNKILIAELLLPVSVKLHHIYKLSEAQEYQEEVLSMLHADKKMIMEDLRYYATVCSQNKFDIINKNYYNVGLVDQGILRDIANHVILRQHTVDGIGLLNGKMGIVIFMSVYSHYACNDAYDSLANLLLEELLDQVNTDMSIGFSEGLTGIGWGLQFLCLNGYLTTGMNELLDQIDDLVFNSGILDIDDSSFDKGLTGLLYYCLSRLKYSELVHADIPFDRYRISKLSEVSNKILDNSQFTGVLTIPINILLYIDNKTVTIDVFDIREFIIPSVIYLKNEDTDLSLFSGLSGKGLSAILNNLIK